MDPQELGFTPQRPVGWLAPLLLLSTGLRTLLAILFGAYLDKRELQNALAGDVFEQPGRGRRAVAGLRGRPRRRLPRDLLGGLPAGAAASSRSTGGALPRGEVLLMGGDQVYPPANGDGYENRTKGPYRAALPEAPADGPRPTLFALPGNHDWYDGLTAFLRLFARRKDGHIGGLADRSSGGRTSR